MPTALANTSPSQRDTMTFIRSFCSGLCAVIALASLIACGEAPAGDTPAESRDDSSMASQLFNRKGAPATSVQFRFDGSANLTGSTVCLSIDGLGVFPATKSGSRYKVNVDLNLPQTVDFYFFESLATDCSTEDAELWTGYREYYRAASQIAFSNTCVISSMNASGLAARADITGATSATFPGTEDCPISSTDIYYRVQTLAVPLEGSQAVCIEIDGDGTIAMTETPTKFVYRDKDVPLSAAQNVRFYVSEDSTCTSLVRYLYTGDANIFADSVVPSDCVDLGVDDLYHSFLVDTGGNVSNNGSVPCPSRYGAESTFNGVEYPGDVPTNPGDEMGSSVATYGSRIVIGADKADTAALYGGTAFVFRKEADGQWTFEQQLTPASSTAFDRFGASMDMHDTNLIVGAWQRNPAGAAIIYERSGTTWSEVTTLTPFNPGSRDYFGWDVAIDNSFALIGAPDADRDSNADRGAAYVYTQTGGTWTAVSELTPSVSEAGQSYGTAVALDGSVAAISAPNASGGGAVFIFRESGGTWTEDQVIVRATDDTTTNGLGVDVAIADGRLIVGASSGTAFVYSEISSNFVLTETINVSGVTGADRFGSSVAITSDYAAVGAFRRNGTASRSGEAYVFRRTAGDFSLESTITAADTDAGDRFGYSLDMDETRIVTGAFRDDVDGSNAGAAYVFE